MKLTQQDIMFFQEAVWSHFRAHQRTMPWRDEPNVYNVLVSELMLQQTQVARVTPKFTQFMLRFPDIGNLAAAPLADVLVAWSGLGYNRRAKFLHEAAKKVVNDFNGLIPTNRNDLMTLPGVGSNTAGAILAYAYNEPVTFIETNIRTVFFHHFFAERSSKVSDSELGELAKQVLDTEQPREWYWALMDYGSYLKKTAGTRLDSSKHYKKQTVLKGSPREMRGRIIKALTGGSLTELVLRDVVAADSRFVPALKSLQSEGMIVKKGDLISLTGHTDTR